MKSLQQAFLTAIAGLILLLLAVSPSHAQAVGFGPVIGSLPDGAIMNVTPVATADRRYVRMTMNPQFIGAQGFNTWTVPGAVSGGGGGFGFNGGGLGGTAFGGYGPGYGYQYGNAYGPAYVEPAFTGGLGGIPVPPPQTYNALGPLGGAIRRSTRANWYYGP